MKSFFHLKFILTTLIALTVVSSAQAASPDPIRQRLIEVETALRPFMRDGFTGIQNHDVAAQLVYLAYRIQGMQNSSKAFAGDYNQEQGHADETAIRHKYEILVEQFISWLTHEIYLRKSIGAYDSFTVAALTSIFFTQLIKISMSKRKNPTPFLKVALDTFKKRIRIEATEPSALSHDNIALTVFALSWSAHTFGLGNSDIVSGTMYAGAFIFIASNILNKIHHKYKNKSILEALKEIEKTIDLIEQPLQCRNIFY